MVTYREGPHAAQFILDEANGQRSRDNVDVPVGQKFLPGTVLKDGVPATGAVAGPGLAIAIYGMDTTPETGTGEAGKVACITRDAEVNRHAMAWPEGFDDSEIDDAATALADQGIIVRGAPLPSPSESVTGFSAPPSPGDQRRSAPQPQGSLTPEQERALYPPGGTSAAMAGGASGTTSVQQPSDPVQRPGDEPLKS